MYIPATIASFLLSLVPLLILFMGIFWLREIPTWQQVSGVAISLAGGYLFFSHGLGGSEAVGIVIVLVGVLDLPASVFWDGVLPVSRK